MKYKVESDIKYQIVVARTTIRDVAIKLGISPTTLSSKLNGYSPLSDEEREKINGVIESFNRGHTETTTRQ